MKNIEDFIKTNQSFTTSEFASELRDEIPDIGRSTVFKILREKAGKVAPFRVMARQQNCFIPECIRVVFQIGIYFPLNIFVLCIEFVAFLLLRCA